MRSPEAPTVSVLLPVHGGVSAAHFERCMKSIYDQSRPADEVIVVEDGPLPEALKDVLTAFDSADPAPVRVRLLENLGAGAANQAGLLRATGTWIAKMDADDIAVRRRFEHQLQRAVDLDVDVLGSAMAEFGGCEEQPTGIRSAPLTHAAIARRMPWNSPMNHSSTFYRRAKALEAGGYSNLRNLQDYDLFARMLAAGARMHNDPDVLVLFRSTPAMLARRRSRTAIRCEVVVQRNLQRYGLIGPVRRRCNLVFRLAFRMLPRPLLRSAYRLLFVRRVNARATEMVP